MEMDSNTIILEDFDVPLSAMDKTSRQKINKETLNLNSRLEQTDLTDTYRTFHPTAEEYTCFSHAHEIFSSVDHILHDKTSLHKFKKIEIISSIFSNHNSMKLEIIYKKRTGKFTNM